MMCRGLMVLLCLAPLTAQADSREQIQEQIDRLGAEQQQVRQRAIYRLRRIGKPAISSLINALRRTEPTVRSGAAKSLGLMGSVARRAAPALARSLEDPVEGVQQEAMDALRRIGREAVSSLTKALGHRKRQDVRILAARALGRIGPEAVRGGLSALVRALNDPHKNVRIEACQALARIGKPAAAAVPVLITLLGDKFDKVQQAAKRALAKLGEPPLSALPGLIQIMSSKFTSVRQTSASYMGSWGAEGRGAVPALLAALGDPVSEVKVASVDSLAEIGVPAIPALIKALKGRDDQLRIRACRGLGKIGTSASSATVAVIKLLDHKNALEVRLASVEAVVAIGVPLGPAIQGLVLALRDTEVVVRAEAAKGLGQLGPLAAQASAGVLIKALSDDAWSVRANATESLGKMGQLARKAAPVMVYMLTDEMVNVRKQAQIALVKIGVDSVPSLIKGLAHKRSAALRKACAETLADLAMDAEAAVEPLIAALEDPDSGVRQSAGTALVAIGDPTVKHLREQLKSEDAAMRQLTLALLGRMGQAAELAIDEMLELLDDEEIEVGDAAAAALKKLRPQLGDASLQRKIRVALEKR